MRNEEKIIRTDYAVCKFKCNGVDIIFNGDCKLFDCTEFRDAQCRRKLFIEKISQSNYREISQAWFGDSEFILRINKDGENAHTNALKVLNEFEMLMKDICDACDCPLEKEILSLKKAISDNI